MTTHAPLRILCGALTLAFALASAPSADAVFGFFTKKKRLPSQAERAEQDRQAAPRFAEGQAAEQAGDFKRALGHYHYITKKLPYAEFAAEAQFREAEMLLKTGEPLDSFKAYQALITNHPQSSRFQRSIEQQYNIAVESLTGKHSSILGIVPRRVPRSQVVEMFQTVVKNAPSSIYAANSYYYVGRIYESQNEKDKAIEALQKVVDDYPLSPKAPQSQLRIAEILGRTARRPDNPGNLKETREAYEDFITNFPEHERSDEVVAQLNVIDEKEAQKSLKIARFYAGNGNLKAAAIYFNKALGSANAALNQEARQQLALISEQDPEALKLAQVDPSATKTPPQERLKNRDQYVGPPAPDRVEGGARSRLVPSAVEPPVEEPSLPGDQPEGDLDSLVPLELLPSTEILDEPDDAIEMPALPEDVPAELLPVPAPPEAEEEPVEVEESTGEETGDEDPSASDS